MKFGLFDRVPFLRNWRFLIAILLPILLLPIPILGKAKTSYAIYSLLIIAVYWMTEALPIAVTALLPIVFYPMFGICDSDLIAREYLKDSIMVFVGSLNIALAFEFCNLHKRIALKVVLCTGLSTGRLMFGVMFTTMFLSMWMFNTAATAMMVPIISTIVDELEAGMKAFSEDNEEKYQKDNLETINEWNCKEGSNGTTKTMPDKIESENENTKAKELLKVTRDMRSMFLLSICYSSNIGGTGVVTGTGTNIVALEFIGDLDPAHHGNYATLSFATWMAFNIPPMLVNLVIAWVYLQFVFIGIPNKLKFWKNFEERKKSNAFFNKEIEKKITKLLEAKYADLGKLNLHEILVASVFFITVISWILHEPKIITGWSSWFAPTKVSLSTASLLFALLFFIIPRNAEFYRGFITRDFKGVTWKPLLEYEYVTKKFPWGSILLLGGGYALSLGTKKSGLSTLAGESLSSLGTLSPGLLQFIIMTLIGFATEIASNTATASITIPVLLELSQELNLHPFYLTLPAAVTCSYAFMLPVATVPNAIVYAASTLKITEMIRVGFFMNFACIIVLYISINLYGNLFFNFNDYSYVP